MQEEIIRIDKVDDEIRFHNNHGIIFNKLKDHQFTIEFEGTILDVVAPKRKVKSGVRSKC